MATILVKQATALDKEREKRNVIRSRIRRPLNCIVPLKRDGLGLWMKGEWDVGSIGKSDCRMDKRSAFREESHNFMGNHRGDFFVYGLGIGFIDLGSVTDRR